MSYHFETLQLHVGQEQPDPATGARAVPIYQTTSYVFRDCAQAAARFGLTDAGNIYGRLTNSTQDVLEQRVAALEGGVAALATASGAAAVTYTIQALARQGDHIVAQKTIYGGTYNLLANTLPPFGITASFVDAHNLAEVEGAIRPNTKLIHIETPGNPTLMISDIAAIADIAHRHGALLSVDNTFASPFNQRPIELGADFAVESLTKYINGHGDSMGGAIIGKTEYLDIIRAQSQVNLGGTISPFNAWLIMRGSVTLPLRMRQHNENAMAVARWLEKQPCVSFVAYPGLESHKGHEVAKKQMSPGFGGVLSFGLKADHDTHNRFVSYLKVITSAVSLGHDESLIVFLGENDERQYLYPEAFHNGFFRFSVGIEDAEDIIGDLKQALEKTGLEVRK